MKLFPVRFYKIAISIVALVFSLMLPSNLCAQSNSGQVPSVNNEGKIILTILRDGDANFSLAGRQRNGGGQRHQHGEKARPEAAKGDKKKSPERPADRKRDSAKKSDSKKEGADAPKSSDCKKAPCPQAAAKVKGDCPACKKSDGGKCEACKKQAPTAANNEKGESRPRQPQRSEGNQDKMRKHGGPEVDKIRVDLERTKKELERAHQSLHMAHKELGDKTLHIKKLEDQVQNFRTQLGRAETEMQKLQKLNGEQKKLAEILQSERRKNEALQNDVAVVQKKAKEAISKIQAQAELHVAQSHERMQAEMREHADKLRKHAAGSPKHGTARKAAPEKSEPQPKRPDAKSRGTAARAPREPEPNKPAESKALSIAPIIYSSNSAVNFEERTRVLKDVTALLEKAPDAKFKIIGHADDSPHGQVNQDISKNRASFLGSFLRVNGVDPKKIISQEGVGNTAPEKGAANNRRVVIEVVK